MMDEPKLKDWAALMLEGNDIVAARIRVGKAKESLDQGGDKVAQLLEIVQGSETLAEARQKAIAAGLLPKK